MEEFKTILQNSTAEVEEKKSKFIADIFYVENILEAEEKIKSIKKKYFDARHHCYAYRIIEENGVKEKQSDDGEPSGTAGAPMLNILKKNELINVLVIVTRYFGGTLLGTGGLVRAYSEASLKAIEEAGIGVQKFGHELEIIIEYKELERFKYYCKKHSINILEIVYENNIICKIELTNEEKEELLKNEQKDVQILKYNVLGEKYIKVEMKNDIT